MNRLIGNALVKFVYGRSQGIMNETILVANIDFVARTFF